MMKYNVTCLLELEGAFIGAEEARKNASSQAIEAVNDASMNMMKLIRIMIDKAINEDHSGMSIRKKINKLTNKWPVASWQKNRN